MPGQVHHLRKMLVSFFFNYKNNFPKTSTYICYKRRDSFLQSISLSTVIPFICSCHLANYDALIATLLSYTLKLHKSTLPKSGKVAYLNQTLASISIAVVHAVYTLYLTGTRNYCKIPIHFSAGSRRGALNHA